MSLLNTLLKTDNGISFAALWDVQEPKSFQRQGDSPPWPTTRGSAPGPRWGLRPQTPVIGSRSTHSPWPRPLLAPPTFKHFQRPWLTHSTSIEDYVQDACLAGALFKTWGWPGWADKMLEGGQFFHCLLATAPVILMQTCVVLSVCSMRQWHWTTECRRHWARAGYGHLFPVQPPTPEITWLPGPWCHRRGWAERQGGRERDGRDVMVSLITDKLGRQTLRDVSDQEPLLAAEVYHNAPGLTEFFLIKSQTRLLARIGFWFLCVKASLLIPPWRVLGFHEQVIGGFLVGLSNTTC